MITVFLALSLFATLPAPPRPAIAAPALVVLQPAPAPDPLATIKAFVEALRAQLAQADADLAAAAARKANLLQQAAEAARQLAALGGVTPTPNPQPPIPNPPPVLSERATKIRDLALSQVPVSAERAAVAARVAVAYASATGADAQALVNNAGAAGIAALGPAASAWRPFFVALVAEMGRWDLSTVDLTRAALADVAAGLREVN